MQRRQVRTRIVRTAAAFGCAVLLAVAAPVVSAAAAPTPAKPLITVPPPINQPHSGATPFAAKPNGAICYYGACYNYVAARQTVKAAGASVLMYQARPELDTNDPSAHSLQELAVESRDGKQIVEVGWTVDKGLNGDTQPHLFTFHWVDGVPTCYNACGYVSTLPFIKPGQRLDRHSIGEFGIVNHRGNWWILYDGLPIGYYPGALWGGGFSRFGLVQAFGEVASTAKSTCTDMGDGRLGSNPFSSWITGFHLVRSSAPADLTIGTVTTPDEYDSGFVTATSYHLGGPGSGRCTTSHRGTA